jgi:hypothetical protein
MSIKLSDHVSGVSTAGSHITAGARRQLAPAVRTFLVQVGISEPPEGTFIKMDVLDKAMEGNSIERRMCAKGALAVAGLIA